MARLEPCVGYPAHGLPVGASAPGSRSSLAAWLVTRACQSRDHARVARPRALGSEDIAKARSMREQGFALRAIGDVFGVSAATILAVLGGSGSMSAVVVAVNGRRYRPRPPRDPRPCRWCDGPNTRSAATCCQVCELERRRCREYLAGRLPSVRGWPPRPHPAPTRALLARQLRAAGLSYSRIAVELGVSLGTVWRDLHDERLP